MENIDVTPCTDAAGNLAPGAACALVRAANAVATALENFAQR
jgi:hypothetical protein